MDRSSTMTRSSAAATRQAPKGDGEGAGDRDGNGSGRPPEGGPARSGRRRRGLIAGTVVLATVVVAVAVASRSGGSDGTASNQAPAATAPVEVRTLTQTDRIDGTLDFGESRGVAAGTPGTLTGVAAEGSTVDRGETLFTVDQHPTVLLIGAIPLYRDLAAGVGDGQDVVQLEENLDALGHTDDGAMVVDEHFDDATTGAVEAWQQARGVEVTGRVTPADAVFLPGPARIAQALLDPGASVQQGAAVVEYTGSTRVVRAQIEPSQADLAHVGAAVTITLPDGTEVGGAVAAVADTATSGSGAEGGQSQGSGSGSGSESTATIDVTITLDDQAAAEAYTTAGVDVNLTGRQREDVLAVPVTALVALAGTGYAVEVLRDDGATELVPVEPGMYADGYVEVGGEGLDEGTDVVVAEP